MQWPDVDLCRKLTSGFRTAGDLRVQTSNVFRPAQDLTDVAGTAWREVQSAPPGAVPYTDKAMIKALASGKMRFTPECLIDMKARPATWQSVAMVEGKLLQPVSFEERWQAFSSEEASLEWLEECKSMLESRAARAKAAAAKGDTHDMNLLRAVQARTAEEVGVDHVGPAMSTKTLLEVFSTEGGFLVRVAPRFGILQVVKMNCDTFGIETPLLDEKGEEIWKLRCRDDFKCNGVNGVTWLLEHLVMPNFEFPARVASEFSELLDVRDKTGTKRQREEEDPGLVLGLDDLFAAYRRIPNADSRRFGIVGIYNLELEAVVWHAVKGLPFGLSSVPSIFNRVPALLCVLARNWCGVAVDQFVDDYICVDRDDSPITEHGRGGQVLWSSSGQWALCRIHQLCGLDLEPSKRKHAGPKNVLLGVDGDLSGFKTLRQVQFRPTGRRCKSILRELRRCAKEKRLLPREAANLLGRLTFVLSSAYTSVGRAATQPLVDRAADRPEAWTGKKWSWTTSMTHMLAFFEALFQDLPPLSFDFRGKRKSKIVIYSDASIDPDRNGLGFIVFDQETNESWWCASPCPQELMEKWAEPGENPWLMRELVGEKDKDTHINAMELLGLLAVVWTLGPEVLTGRDVLMFCDNTAAMSATVHGYARSPNLAAISNTLHLALATLRCNLWVEWVPSDANCADVPSRPQGPEALLFHEKLGCKQWQGGMRFPTIAQIQTPRIGDVCQQR